MYKIIKKWKEKHPDTYEFIIFNLMSEIATVTNFFVLWLCVAFIYKRFANEAFNWFIFKYPVKESGDGGLCGFLAFLTAYICAQTVNFIVQRKLVFKSNISISKVLPMYILTVFVVAIISVWLPPYVMSITTPYIGGTSSTYIANIANIIIQVIIIYPMMKYVIMKKE